jgi:hypothetical protein
LTVLPVFEASRVERVIAPVNPIFKIGSVVPCASEPAPLSKVLTVKVPLFVYDPPMLSLGMTIAFTPLKVLPEPVNRCTPVLAVSVPSFCRLPAKVGVIAAFSVQVPLIVTFPVNVLFEFVALLNVMVPLTVVVPDTLRANPATVSENG